jgi:hypothetical protein
MQYLAAASARLQCPTAPEIFYQGMDAPTAMCRSVTLNFHVAVAQRSFDMFHLFISCSNCFKKRRDHTIPPESAVDAEKAGAQAAQSHAVSAAAAALKLEQQRLAAAVAEGKMRAEKESAARVSAEAAATAAAAFKVHAAAEAEAHAAAVASSRVRRESEMLALHEKHLQVCTFFIDTECQCCMYSHLTVPQELAVARIIEERASRSRHPPPHPPLPTTPTSH